MGILKYVFVRVINAKKMQKESEVQPHEFLT